MNLADPGPPSDLARRLEAHGFKLVEQWTDGPMGSAKFLFSDGAVDIGVFNDRGQSGVDVGGRGAATFGCYVWRKLLEVDSAAPSGVDGELAWIIDHLEDIRGAIRDDADIERTLGHINFSIIKARHGFPPDADPDNPKTWRRA